MKNQKEQKAEQKTAEQVRFEIKIGLRKRDTSNFMAKCRASGLIKKSDK